MKSIRLRFLVAALAVVMGAAVSKAQSVEADAPPPPPAHGHGWEMRGPMGGIPFRELGVTDEQRTQIKAVMQKEHSTMKPLMLQIHQMNEQLKQYEEGTFDQAKVQALVSQQAQTLVQLKVEESRIHNELYQLLTSDQQAKLKEIEANREARMQKHMQGGSESTATQQ